MKNMLSRYDWEVCLKCHDKARLIEPGGGGLARSDRYAEFNSIHCTNEAIKLYYPHPSNPQNLT
jgi:hypothetical protein